MHGDLEQSERTATLDSFRAGNIDLLVCSDVAARGLDIADVSHVFNFDVPFNAEDYVHRIGRTGRAGKPGKALTLVTPDDDKLVQAIETLIKKEISRTHMEGLPEPNPRLGRRESGPRKGRHDRRADRSRSRHPTHEVQETAPAAPQPTAAPVKIAAPRIAAVPTPKSATAFGENLPSFLRPRSANRAK